MDLVTEYIKMDIHTASNLGREDIITQILNDGSCCIDDKNTEGWTPLMYACWSSHEHVVQFLLRAGASLNTLNSSGQTPLMLAVISGNMNIVKHTLRRDVIDIQDSLGKTALHHAVEYCYLPLVSYLLIMGANPNTTAISGSTPLMVATTAGQCYLVELLIKYGARNNTRSLKSSTSMQTETCDKRQNSIADLHLSKSTDSPDLKTLLESLSLEKYWPVFESKNVDLNEFLQLTEEDLKSIGIKLLGPRRKMSLAIKSLSEK